MTEYKTLFSLGAIYPSDFLKPGEEPRCAPVELKLVMDENGTVCLEKSAPNDVMWGERYWYMSSISSTMRKQLEDIVTHVDEVFKTEIGDVWLDIAQNDAYMLSCVKDRFDYMTTIGIDPVGGEIKKQAEAMADLILQYYFAADVYKRYMGDKKAKVISCVSMFYDLSEPGKFLDDVYEVLDDNGLFILQLSYSPLMLAQLEFSNIVHEHKKYYGFRDLNKLLIKHRFKVVDVSVNNTNSGSFRLHIMKEGADIKKYGSQTHRDVCSFRIESMLYYEYYLCLNEPETWYKFFMRINVLKEETVSFVKAEKEKGKIIYAYGASTKGHTLLSFFGLDSTIITAIADKNPDKHGLITVGTKIPIVSEQSMREAHPDYLLILPAHFLQEFMEREKEYLERGGKMIVCMPSFMVIEK